MLKILILKGLPASGKSTYAKNLIDSEPGRWKRINKDEIRMMLDNGRWSKENEQFVLEMRDWLILKALAKGKHVIVDDTNLHQKHEAKIRELTKGLAEIEVKFFDTPIEECISRDLKRLNSVGEKVIRDMHKQFLAPKIETQLYGVKQGLPWAVICDIDGTLALMKDRGPFETSKYNTDVLNEKVAEAFELLTVNTKYARIIVSGRSDEFRDVTERWLSDHGIQYDHLYMRTSGDTRKDFIIKNEIFDSQIRGKFNIFCVLDDRNQVVEMWRSLGLVVLQVADGDF